MFQDTSYEEFQQMREKRKQEQQALLDTLGYQQLPDGRYVKAENDLDKYEQQLNIASKEQALQESQEGIAKTSAAERESLSDAQTSLQSIQDLKNIINTADKLDLGRSQLFKGALRTIFGQSIPWVKASEDELKFDTIARNLEARFIKFLSGAQVSDKERERLMKFLPQLSDTEDELEAKLNSLETFIQRSAENKMQQLGIEGEKSQQMNIEDLRNKYNY